MRFDTAKFMVAFIEIYNEFSQIYDEWTDSFALKERVELFKIAWNDPFLGDLLKQEMMQKARELDGVWQEKKEMDAEAEAGEATVI